MQVFAFDIRQKKKRILNMRGFSVVVFKDFGKTIFALRDSCVISCAVIA